MILSAHYFLQHTYTYHRRHIREDFAWIASVGARRVVISLLEQDLFAIDANLDCLCEEAERAGLQILALPSRWGGLVAGAPKTPSLRASSSPDTWMRKSGGSPELTAFGPIMSIHHPDTMELFVSSLERLLGRWPFAGVVWDEPKALEREDHSPMAKERLPAEASLAWHTQAMADFFDAVGFARSRGLELADAEVLTLAARGPLALTFPWGQAKPGLPFANVAEALRGSSPTGGLPGGASPCGALGLVGNAEEWVYVKLGSEAPTFGGHYESPPGDARAQPDQRLTEGIVKFRVRVVVVDQPRDKVDGVHRRVIPGQIGPQQIQRIGQVPLREQHQLAAGADDSDELPERGDLQPPGERGFLAFGALGQASQQPVLAGHERDGLGGL